MKLSDYCRIKWERAMDLKKKGAFQAAEKELREGLEEQADHPLLKSSLAQLYLREGRMEEARILAESILSLDPQYPQALYIRGEVFLKEDKPDEALQCFRQASQKNARPYLVLGMVRAMRAMERYEEALEALDAALIGEPGNLRYEKEKAVILNRMDRLEEALGLYEKIKKQDPDDAFVRKEIYRLRGLKHPDETMIRELEKVISLSSRKDDAQLHGFLGQKLKKVGKLEEAAAEFRKAVDLEPDNLYFSKQEGFCRYKLGDFPHAIRILGAAFRSDPSDFVVKSTLKKMYVKTGRTGDFITLIEEVLKEHPHQVKLMGTLKGLKKEAHEKNRNQP